MHCADHVGSKRGKPARTLHLDSTPRQHSEHAATVTANSECEKSDVHELRDTQGAQITNRRNEHHSSLITTRRQTKDDGNSGHHFLLRLTSTAVRPHDP